VTVLEANIPEAGYGNKVVLTNISICIEDGEIAAFIGPNGAGKSTLLKALMGIVSARRGSINLDGQSIGGKNPEAIVRLGMSMVPQGNRVFTELSVRENLEMGAYLLKDRAELSRRTDSLLEMFSDLKARLKLDAGKLSGGEKQQLALARALILQPTILLLDEPSLGLSPKLVTKAFQTIKEVNKKFKTTILIVEQKVREVLGIANRVYALRMGEIVFQGKPSQLQEGETLKKIFLA
jgi:branched-chain amino acid transport system ATP-binding protein